jgi:outer membrane protein OmpA-like peptidoglycan-associated protein
MRSHKARNSDSLSVAVSATLATPGRSLGAERQALETYLGGGLSALRIHEGHEVDRAAGQMGARGFALGRHIALSRHASGTTLVHEAAHALQQDMAEPPSGVVPIAPHHDPTEISAADAARAGGTVERGQAPRIQFDLTDPGRLGEVHESLFVQAPGGGGLQPWQDSAPDHAGTAAFIHQQAKSAVQQLVRQNPTSVGGQVLTRTTESALETDAIDIDQRIRARYPQITRSVSEADLRNAVDVLGPGITSDQDFLRQWLANKLRGWTDIAQFDIDDSDPRFVAMLDDILADADIDTELRTLASRQSGFQRGSGSSREIFVHRGVSAAGRRPVLVHELTHFYSHPTYRAWVDSTTDPRLYNEGMTEWLARKVMTTAELTGRTPYQDRVDTIDNQIVPHVSEDGIARAFFLGEVWRLETRSAEARGAFSAQTGISESDTETEQRTASRTAPGLFQTVRPGAHYRFLNLGFDQAQPKAEHVTAFQEIKTAQLDPAPERKLRFVGHASSPGSADVNRRLSRRRSVAFYRMARREGVPWNRMIDADRPPHFGEAVPTVIEEDAISRAMNRRVEMFLIRGGSP